MRAQVDRERAGGVREIPDDVGVGGGGQRGHVGDLAGAVADVREHHERGARRRDRGLRRVDQAQLAAAARAASPSST